MNDFLSSLIKSLTLAGGIVMFMAILITRKILKEVQKTKYHKTWKLLMGLMVFFMFGYFTVAYIVIFGNEKTLLTITDIIFFFGAMFAYIVVRSGYYTIKDLGNTVKMLEKAISDRQKSEEELRITLGKQIEQDNSLLFLAKNIHIGNGDFYPAIQKVTEKTSETLDVERVSVWLFNEKKTSITSIDVYEKSKKSHSKGDILYSKDYPAYFKALEEERVIDANDAHKDPRTSEYSKTYLTPLGITSLLDAPIRIEGKMKGVICFEHTGSIRNWTVSEQSFVSSIVDTLSIAMETSQLKKTEKELEISLSLMRATLESTADGILVVDNKGKISGFNKQFVKMWGIPNGISESKDDNQAIAFVLDQLKYPENFLAKVKELYDNPKLESFDVLEFKDGKVFERFSKPQCTTRDEIIGRVWSFRDVTERKRAEEEIHKLNEQLELRVQKRTEEVVDLNKNLKKNISDLEAANKELESFSYSVSHDLRAPLRSINGFTKLIEQKYKDKIDDEGREYMEIVSRSTKKMEQLIEDLLSFSHLEKKELKKTDVDMKALVNSLLADIDLTQWNSKAKITVKDLIPAVGDSALLAQVFLNMILNALKYSRTKDIPVIEIGSFSEGNENVYYVKDNGVGFNMTSYDKLFKVFQRLHSSEEFEGSGLGLAIVYRVIMRHGGRVWAEGKVNEGATFYFALPNEKLVHPVATSDIETEKKKPS